MDQRQTFADSGELLQFLVAIYSEGRQAAMLVDKGGLERMQGQITEVREDGKGGAAIVIDSSPADAILLHEIIAVNGIFRGDYSEC